MPYVFNSPVKKDWKALVALDPTIATYRRCTSEDMRNLATKSGWEYPRVQRAFTLCLFRRTKYLTLSLDESFEPKPEVRAQAKKILDKRRKKKECTPIKKIPREVKTIPQINKNRSRLYRYKF